MSVVIELSEDDALGGGRVVERPTRAQVLDAFSRLDGERYTQVLLAVEEENVLCVGGGPGGYLVNAFLGEVNRVLCDPDRSDDDVEWVVCGQGSTFPSSMVVDGGRARRAMLCFFDSGGGLDSELEWRDL